MHFKKLTDLPIVMPTRATKDSAGYDLHALEGGVVKVGKRLLIKTGLTVVGMEGDQVGFIKPKSGLAYKHGIDVLAGVIDADYKDDIGVILINHGDHDFKFETGKSIAQLVVIDYYIMSNEKEVRADRMGGFGSTNK